MKKILLVLSGVVLVSHSSFAGVRLIRAWQVTNVFTTAPGVQPDQHIVNAGIGGSRAPSAHSISPGGPYPYAEASASLSSSGTLSNSNFTLSGSLSVNSNSPNPPSCAEGYANTRQFFEFDVIDQEETVTIDLSSFVTSTNPPTSDGPGFYWNLNGPVSTTGMGSSTLVLPVGHYQFNSTFVYGTNGYCTESATASFTYTISFSNPSIQPGVVQSDPVVGKSTGADGAGGALAWFFSFVFSWGWFCPPPVSEFSFQMTSNSHFTDIASFPTGFSDAFEVLAEGQSLGSFTSDQSLNFVELLGHGVSSFRVRNIMPQVDRGDPKAFPIQLGFDTEPADFFMIPSPSVILSADSNNFVVRFAGVLEQSIDLTNWGDVQGSPPSPLLVQKSNSPPKLFFRAHQEPTPTPTKATPPRTNQPSRVGGRHAVKS